MSKRLSRLLDEPEERLAKLIAELEAKNGYPSHDVRHVAETHQKIRRKIIDLNLDADDTTGEELYHALLEKYTQDSNLFDVYCGAKTLGLAAKTEKAVLIVSNNFELPDRWALKTAVSKALLRQHPPKKLMKLLGYRSIESMLKRERITELLIGAKLSESKSWNKEYQRSVSHMDQSSFVLQELKLVPLVRSKFAGISDGIRFIHCDESASIGFLPDDSMKNAPLLTMVLLLAEELSYYGEIKITQRLSKMNGVIGWWEDMDHLVAELLRQPISMNIKDVALNELDDIPYRQRQLGYGRRDFWHELVQRYENLPQLDGIFDNTALQSLSMGRRAPEPAYEFVEDF